MDEEAISSDWAASAIEKKQLHNSVSLVFCNCPLLQIPFDDGHFGRTSGNETLSIF